MSTFELNEAKEKTELSKPSGQVGLSSAVLLHNARWFTQIRWIVVSVFIMMGMAGYLLPESMKRLGLIIPFRWLWILAGVLIIANAIFCFLVFHFKEDYPSRSIKANIWLQIGVDLIVVTVLVHLVGSTDTFISFTYLFHIALACIFFPPKESLLVTLMAVVLYLACVALETAGLWLAPGILIRSQAAESGYPSLRIIIAGSAVFVWLITWYFISSLSEAVRKRDQQLSSANERLIKADEEKNRQVLLTTHDLKAPFAGIESNIEVLKYQFWDEVSEPVRTIINRIDLRSQTLRERIRDILILGDLKTQVLMPEQFVPIDLKSVMEDVLDDLGEKAKARGISLDIQVPSTTVLGNMKEYAILFSNLLANAIFYSHEGGKVEVSYKNNSDGVILSVSDHGIGIRDEALLHIFEEYFRTREAAKFNRSSTGLGLAIVREIARNFGLKIRVTSEMGKGTTFEVTFPKMKQKLNRGV
ncbi:MAG TPA: hypothetical protein ENI06_06775 [Spirochaetales bacterium]|nr:hypothetical protein [Spirochaetales bacterium]